MSRMRRLFAVLSLTATAGAQELHTVIERQSLDISPRITLSDVSQGPRYRIPLMNQRSGTLTQPTFVVQAGRKTLPSSPATPERAAKVRNGEPAFIETVAPSGRIFQGSLLRLYLRVGIERRTLTEHLIQIFPQRLDLPVQIDAPWLTDLPLTEKIPTTDDATLPAALRRQRASLVVNGALATAEIDRDIERDGRTFAVFELPCNFVLRTAGSLHVPPAKLRFAWATRFQEDLVTDHVPIDRQDGLVLSNSLDLQIEPLPRLSKPADFGGAVGTFAVQATATPLEVDLNDSIQLTLSITGEGNLAFFDPPTLPAMPGFHLRGRSEQLRNKTRAITYDLAVRSTNLFVVPAITLPFFEPLSATYQTIETQPIPLRVRRASAPPQDANALPSAATGGSFSRSSWLLTVLATAILLGIVVRRKRSRP
ncbi:hypothetical protein LBMAG49_12840 [Planctomycetota bacterium]|nr:hypothetical protein LBMAG49_12840 [Planctomycetota bacterium]